MVIINKVDLVGPVHIEVIRDWIGQQLNRIRIIEARHCEVPLEILLAVGHFHPENVTPLRAGAHVHAHGHDHERGDASNAFDTWSYESDRPFSIEALREMVRRELPASIYRCKGIVFSADMPEKRFALQAVGRRTEICELDEWGARAPRTQIVAIGTKIDAQELAGKFGACIAVP